MLNILIVDDDEDVLIRLERTLEAEGYSTTTAWSGREALSIARRFTFDILLVDEHLADMKSAIVVDKLRHLQPRAFLLLMDAQRKCNKSSPHRGNAVVCKWDDDEVKAIVRNSRAA
jgi:DNA-binding response OmpR family regulator